MKRLFTTAGLGVLVLAAFIFYTQPAAATDVTPVIVAGNPSCADLGYDFGYKPSPEPPPSGTYVFPDGFNTVEISSDGTYFDWESTLSLDAVIVKGGSQSYVYYYDPEETSDTGLHSPDNASGSPANISHIEFCYDYEVDVSKTAVTSYDRTYKWDITKTPDGSYTGFAGDSFVHEYTITVDRTGYDDSKWAVAGEITIQNNTPLNATLESVTDAVSGGIAPTVSCGVSFPYALAAGETLVCSYGPTDLPDGTDRTNTATVETSGQVGGDEDTVDVLFGDPTNEYNATINVTDDNGTAADAGDDRKFGPASDDASFTYSKLFECPTSSDAYSSNQSYSESVVNTAEIDETGDSDTATVDLTCYQLHVAKDANTSYTTAWEWTIVKSADETALVLANDQIFDVNYTVELDASSADSDWAVSGNITISNPNPSSAAELTAVSDLITPGDIAATVSCPSLTVPAGGTLYCTYDPTSLPDGTDRSNTATATLQNYAYDKDGVGTKDGTIDFSGETAVDFSSADVSVIDECVEVTDTNFAAPLGTVCSDQVPATFNYTLSFGQNPDADVVLECGDNTHVNTATFTTNDTETTDDDSQTVTATVTCDNSCTLTQGYWKTHSSYGPAPYDDAWGVLADGADTAFFLSGQSYYEVLWTPPAGNAYYILAHQYIAAELNMLNGSSVTPEVQAAFDDATALLSAYTPDQVGALKGKQKKAWSDLAAVLDAYNNGYIGPGHCSE